MVIKNSFPDKNGFSPLYSSGLWRVAISQAKERESVKDISRHILTDESFILLEGGGYLITAKENNAEFEFQVEHMEKEVVYTIPKGTWHVHCWNSKTKALIVENDNTSDLNSEKHYLTEEEKKRLYSMIQ